jgi:hypothetical protein
MRSARELLFPARVPKNLFFEHAEFVQGERPEAIEDCLGQGSSASLGFKAGGDDEFCRVGAMRTFLKSI